MKQERRSDVRVRHMQPTPAGASATTFEGGGQNRKELQKIEIANYRN
jgi:hypothetical protein